MRLRARDIRPNDTVVTGQGERQLVRRVVPEVSSAKSKRPLLRIICEHGHEHYTRPDTWFEVERAVPKGTRRNAGGTYFTPEHDGLDSIRELLL